MLCLTIYPVYLRCLSKTEPISAHVYWCDSKREANTDVDRGLITLSTLMLYSHWQEPRPGQGRVTNETMCIRSSYHTWTRTGARPIAPLCSGPGPYSLSRSGHRKVPTRPGKPGKIRVHLENLEISWNFEKFNKYRGKLTWNLEKLGG